MGIDLGGIVKMLDPLGMGMMESLFGSGNDKACGAQASSGASGILGGMDSLTKAVTGGMQSIFSGASSVIGAMPSVTEMLNPMIFAGPLKSLFDQVSQLGYAPSTQSTTAGTTGTATGTSYDSQWASAIQSLKKYFDLLDTAAGIGGKDGLIGRNDLEAAAKNPGLPAELRNACKFLLANPAAFNQLDVAAGIGSCDGLIGKCDVDAALAALPKTATSGQSSSTNATSSSSSQASGSTGSASSSTSSGTGTSGTSSSTSSGTGTSSTSSVATQPASNPFANMGAEEIIDSIVHSLDANIDKLASQLKGETNDRTISEIQQQIEKLVAQRTEMFTLLSNLLKAEHDMSMSAIRNIGSP